MPRKVEEDDFQVFFTVRCSTSTFLELTVLNGAPSFSLFTWHIGCVEIPKFVDTGTPQFKPKFDALEKSLKESERLEKEIADVQELKQKISTMTVDEYFEKHPELKKKFDDEIHNDNWGY
ncbi:hypothetical protein ES288_D07G192500v1 [Gossypium darwinii]|uniref:ATP synthase subunit d, mitochondrial n=1 Tax=Gossypium darwinii TaxID=34276 RepID=A0A5D2BY48_GOSDA|nr:hypothetical protein ES288_D07G192500v1 [Gossypium darwinii]